MLVEKLRQGWSFMPNDEAEKPPSFWKLAGEQAYDNIVNGSLHVVHDLKAYLISVGNRSMRLQKEMRERGINPPLGAQFAPGAVMISDTFEDISKSLQSTTDAIERCLEAERGTDKALAALDAVLGLGRAGLGAYSLVEPIGALEHGGPMGGAGAHALAAAGVEGRGVTLAGAVDVAGDGARLSPAGIVTAIVNDAASAGASKEQAHAASSTLAKAGDDEKLAELLGEGPESAAVKPARTKRAAGIGPPPRHHAFPQEKRPWFEDHGFTGARDIDRFCVELDEAAHQAIHGGGNWRMGRLWPNEWNQRVMAELEAAELLAGHKLTFDEAMAVVRDLMREYGIDKPFVPYK